MREREQAETKVGVIVQRLGLTSQLYGQELVNAIEALLNYVQGGGRESVCCRRGSGV